MYAIIGMSPGNGYFKQGVIDQLLEKAVNEFDHVGVFIPDVPAIATYMALGYPENIARGKKAIPQGNNLKNRVKTSITTKGLPSEKIRVFNWKEEIEGNEIYEKYFTKVKELYVNNTSFKQDINEATNEVLKDNPFKKKEIILSDIETGTHYILSEFAFMLFMPSYLNQNLVSYVYHKPWPVFEKFIKGEYDGEIKDKIVFIQYPEFK
jgi:cyclo(L-tyrosyl-L-tyrosyl) synthase